MKKCFFFLILATVLFSCAGQKSTDVETVAEAGTQVFSFKDSCKNLVVSLSLELPMGEDSASVQMRDSLIADFIRCARQPGYDAENEFGVKPYGGDMSDAQAVVDYYGEADYDFLLAQALEDYQGRVQYVEEDTMMTLEDKKRIMEDVPQWAFELNVRQTTDTLGFVVYHSQTYVYYGGAHGGVGGSGALTFRKDDGSRIACFVEPGATKALQPLIRKGLLRYYGDAGEAMTDAQLSERLQIEGTVIPQPRTAPCPNATGDSLVFTYGQYEIACYADGMPSFMIAVKDLMPYLTKEGKALFESFFYVKE